MGKGKNDRSYSNPARRRRKARNAKFFKHILKHPSYWNSKNPALAFQLHMIFVFYVIFLAFKKQE